MATIISKSCDNLIISKKITNLIVKSNLTANIIINNPSTSLKVEIKPNSKVNILLYINKSKKLNLDIFVSKNAKLNFFNINLCKSVSSKINQKFRGVKGSFSLNSVFICESGTQNHIINMQNNYRETKTNATIIAISKNDSIIKIKSSAKIIRGRINSDTNQQLKGIIKDNSNIYLDPILLIDEYDIKAAHGAAVGFVNSNILYYMQSRGLTKQQSEKLYLLGQLSPIIKRIWDLKLQRNLINLIKEEL